ncbi:MAG: phosphatase PAP2 family protein [Methanoregula sp.]
MATVETDLIFSLQQQFPALASPMQAVSVIDLGIVYILLVTALYVGFTTRSGVRAGILLGISSGLNDALKFLLHQPRPYWTDARVEGLNAQSSFGMPSTQAQLAVSVYLYCAYAIRRYWAWALALFLVIISGFARIYLGAHDLAQVLSGFAVGAILLALFVTLDPLLTPHITKLEPPKRILLAFGGSIVLILVTLAALSFTTGGWTTPPDWNATAFASAGKPISPFNPAQTFSSAGLLFGLSAGYVLLSERGGYTTERSWRRRGAACILALVAVYILSGCLDWVIALFPRSAILWLMYLRMTVIGLFIGYALPYILIRAGLGSGSKK